jgi:hypothetical protein
LSTPAFISHFAGGQCKLCHPSIRMLNMRSLPHWFSKSLFSLNVFQSSYLIATSISVNDQHVRV